MRTLAALAGILALAWTLGARDTQAHGAGDGDLRIAHLSGGGPKATDCLVGLELVGYDRDGTKKAACNDGDVSCDRDRLANGHCEFWVRACVNGDEEPRCDAAEGVGAVTLDHDGADFDLVTIERALDLVTMPATAPNACAALTKVTVPLGQTKRGKARKGQKVIRLTATGTAGTTDRDAVKLLCKPPKKAHGKRGATFATIQNGIFAKQCAFSGCHSLESPQADLVLEGAGVWDALVDVPASTSAAAFAGKKRVVPGAPDTSFLMDKLLGKLGPGEGDPMPQGRSALPDDDIQLIRKWILAGAPRTEVFGGSVSAQLDDQPRIPPPARPAGGYQAHMDPVVLGDQLEIEGCQYVRLDNDAPIDVRAWELAMHEGSHHLIVYALNCRDADDDGTNDCDEPGFDDQFPTGFTDCNAFSHSRLFLVGAQTPHFQVDYQTPATGVALPLHTRQPLLINSHYTNPYKDTLAEVWVNVTPADPADVRHRARILFEVVANAFIKVPPGTRNTDAKGVACAFSEDPFCAATGEPAPAAPYFALMGVTSHMHKRSTKFVTDLFVDGAQVLRGGENDMVDPADGSKHLYVSTEYSDPVNLTMWPPMILTAGDQLRYGCFMDNGVTEPVRMGCEEEAGVAPGKSILEQFLEGGGLYDGAARFCRTDADCTGFGTGRCVPANLVFGELAEDDMCILPGLYYRCGDTPESCSE